jgi:hypothetical protein
VEKIVEELRYQVNQRAQDRSAQEIERVLRDVATVARATLIGLGEQPRSARDVGVPDEPPPEMVRQIRCWRFQETESLELPGLDTTPRRPRVAVAQVAVGAMV